MTKRLLSTCAVIILAAGCRGVPPPVEGRLDPHQIPQVSFTDARLSRATAIDQPRLSRSEAGNLLYVTVPIRNTTRRQYDVDYRVTFLTAGGRPTGTYAWKTMTLSPQVTQYMEANSTTEDAADFQIDIRRRK